MVLRSKNRRTPKSKSWRFYLKIGKTKIVGFHKVFLSTIKKKFAKDKNHIRENSIKDQDTCMSTRCSCLCPVHLLFHPPHRCNGLCRWWALQIQPRFSLLPSSVFSGLHFRQFNLSLAFPFFWRVVPPASIHQRPFRPSSLQSSVPHCFVKTQVARSSLI